MVTHIDIHPDAEIGPGLLIPHAGPIRVHPNTKIGADCLLIHGCTIGAGPGGARAVIGDHVHISCQSSIIGKVTIGDRAMIAANSLVIANVPAGATAIGVPARILLPAVCTVIRDKKLGLDERLRKLVPILVAAAEKLPE